MVPAIEVFASVNWNHRVTVGEPFTSATLGLGSFFDTLGAVRPGRTFGPMKTGGAAGHCARLRSLAPAFSADPAIVGKTITIEKALTRDRSRIGVMGPEFRFQPAPKPGRRRRAALASS
jgi:hypothetical protein